MGAVSRAGRGDESNYPTQANYGLEWGTRQIFQIEDFQISD
jgi:hypothetical protein